MKNSKINRKVRVSNDKTINNRIESLESRPNAILHTELKEMGLVSVRKIRTCLKCGKDFKSLGNYNRRCKKCERSVNMHPHLYHERAYKLSKDINPDKGYVEGAAGY